MQKPPFELHNRQISVEDFKYIIVFDLHLLTAHVMMHAYQTQLV